MGKKRKYQSKDPWRKFKHAGRANLRARLLEKTGGKCYYCGCPLTTKTVTLDHRHAKSNGGSDKVKNLVAACFDCNNMKGDMDWKQFQRMSNQGLV